MTLHDRLQDIFRTVFADDALTISDSTTATDVDGWDSVMHINLMFTIEQQFGVQFAGDQFNSFENVGQLKQFLAERTGHKDAA